MVDPGDILQVADPRGLPMDGLPMDGLPMDGSAMDGLPLSLIHI